jgi:hypothetical protein
VVELELAALEQLLERLAVLPEESGQALERLEHRSAAWTAHELCPLGLVQQLPTSSQLALG